MATFIVTYDLMQQGQNYSCITKKLEAYGTRWRFQQSSWIIVSSETAMQIASNLRSCLDSNDKLFVGQLQGDAAWVGYDQKGTDWLRSVLT